MKSRMKASVLLVSFLGAVSVYADVTMQDGTYTYNDTTGSKCATVAAGVLEFDNTSPKWIFNVTSGEFEPETLTGAVGTFDLQDDGYRYSGNYSETGVCTFYVKSQPL